MAPVLREECHPVTAQYKKCLGFVGVLCVVLLSVGTPEPGASFRLRPLLPFDRQPGSD
jgi:hypothetical protein